MASTHVKHIVGTMKKRSVAVTHAAFFQKNWDDDADPITSVDPNQQRENLLHSEKVFAYKMNHNYFAKKPNKAL